MRSRTSSGVVSIRLPAASAANTSVSTKRRAALWRRNRRRAAFTMRSLSATVSRSVVTP